ncbi:HAD family hydrolase [Natrarchaeobius halalkaliphilus]|uniref:HAD family hydrolase n=1 Tax=Natrarchaeobius halalkaliphilus TaxID=1679091 RepID=A0A3N6NU08_9EURY|nr:HAD hydrolase-like protein [Natrarchaeobius halalkaliphilus]RQG86186.1 HAD family hydrolase [Natrarchaeobius halalkaliphilus]
MTDYDAVVYDLDGTLVELDVDWNAVAADVLAVYDSADVEPPTTDIWDLLERAPEFDLETEAHSAVAAHEREGAPTSPRLAHADDLEERSVPVGVCSLNCETACRIALDRHGLDEAVDIVVGRDTVARQKPYPEPLLEAVDKLDAVPERTLFIGDSPSDELTAERAGTAFEYVHE